MTPEELEQQARAVAGEFSFIAAIVTSLRTPATLTMRFQITEHCFIQLYGNTRKGLFSYTLMLAGGRIFGRDCEGGQWHRHPFESPDSHDETDEGRKPVTFREFLVEVESILRRLQPI